MRPLIPGWLFIMLMLLTFYICAIAIVGTLTGGGW